MYGMTEVGVIGTDLYGAHRPVDRPGARHRGPRVRTASCGSAARRRRTSGSVDPTRWADGWLHTRDAGTVDPDTGLVTVTRPARLAGLRGRPEGRPHRGGGHRRRAARGGRRGGRLGRRHHRVRPAGRPAVRGGAGQAARRAVGGYKRPASCACSISCPAPPPASWSARPERCGRRPRRDRPTAPPRRRRLPPRVRRPPGRDLRPAPDGRPAVLAAGHRPQRQTGGGIRCAARRRASPADRLADRLLGRPQPQELHRPVGLGRPTSQASSAAGTSGGPARARAAHGSLHVHADRSGEAGGDHHDPPAG